MGRHRGDRGRRVSVREARRILAQQEEDRLVDWDTVIETAVRRVEQAGVVFIDEIDKTINADAEYSGEVSGEGVQRDLLPIIEGSVVMTGTARYEPTTSCSLPPGRSTTLGPPISYRSCKGDFRSGSSCRA